MTTKKEVKPVEETIVENKENASVDIEKMIQEAVAKAVSQAVTETSKKYEDKITELQDKLEETDDEEMIANIKPDKMIWIQHMAPGGASFHRGRINVSFEKLFDKKRIKWEVLDDMYYEFRNWFDNSEIAILDKEARMYYGIEESYKESGADEHKFVKMLSERPSAMIDEIDKFSFMVASAFLKYFIEEYRNGNPLCLKDKKMKLIQEFYQKKYNINNLTEIINEMNLNE